MQLKDIIHNGKSEQEIERIFRDIFEEDYDKELQFIFYMHQKYTREERKNFHLLRVIDGFLYDEE